MEVDLVDNDGDCNSPNDVAKKENDVAISSSAVKKERADSHNAERKGTTDTNQKADENVSLSVNMKSERACDSEQFDVEIMEEDYESIAIMIDELMKDDPAVRIKAIRSLPIISKALGEQRTRNELIPYITQMIDDDDEVLLVLMEEMERLLTLRLIGGSSAKNNEHSFCLIPPFERLCCVEEKVIRDEAVSKFGRILHDMPFDAAPHHLAAYALPLLERLCGSDWHTARISGASLIASVFGRLVDLLEAAEQRAGGDVDGVDVEVERLKQGKATLLGLLGDLAADSIPIVRRSAMVSLGSMVAALSGDGDGDSSSMSRAMGIGRGGGRGGSQEVISLYLPIFKKLAGDDQDNVRVFAVETLLRFRAILSCDEVKDHLLYHIRLLALDGAWRVRYIAAAHFIALCSMLDAVTIRDSMINYFIRLLEDQEPEVRAVAISKIPGISKLIGVALSVEKLIPNVKQLVADSNKYARASLAAIIIPFCYLLPHRVVTEHIVHCILLILKDQFPNVRLHVIECICRRPEDDQMDGDDDDDEMDDDQIDAHRRFDIKLLEESIIPSVIELTLDSDWRVRLGIIEKFPALAQQFGLRFFDQRLFDLSLAALEDNVADIRIEAASNQLQIANVFDHKQTDHDRPHHDHQRPPPKDWAAERLIPALLRKARDSKHYLHRIVYLLSFKFLVEGLGPQRAEPLLSEIVRLLSDDPVANVRFKACQVVTFLVEHHRLDPLTLSAVIVPKLERVVKQDADVDVVYFATQCLHAIECQKDKRPR